MCFVSLIVIALSSSQQSIDAQNNGIDYQQKLSRGYYFIQEVNTYHTSNFGAISTPSEASRLVNILSKNTVSGVEYGLLYFHPEDISACVSVAKVFQKNGIDLWLTSARLQKQISAFNKDVFPSQYRAFSMTSEGSIVPAAVWSLGADEKVPAFDSMNPAAMEWFLRRYRETFLKPMMPYTTGYFFNEDCLYYGLDPGYQNNKRIDYWDLPAYSDSVLKSWQTYCAENSVTYEGQIVSRFPVHRKPWYKREAAKLDTIPAIMYRL